MAVILDFRSEQFYLLLICKLPRYLNQISSHLALSVQETKGKTDSENGRHCSHLEHPFRTILAIFDRQIAPILPINFQVKWPSGSGKDAQKWFSRCRSLRPIFANFGLQVTPMPSTKFRLNWLRDGKEEKLLLNSEKEAQKRFSRSSWICGRNGFSFLFWICKLPQYFLPSLESIGITVQEKKRKIDFQDGGHCQSERF